MLFVTKLRPLILRGGPNIMHMRLMSSLNSDMCPNFDMALGSKEVSQLKSFILGVRDQLKEKRIDSKLDAPCKITNDEVAHLIYDIEKLNNMMLKKIVEVEAKLMIRRTKSNSDGAYLIDWENVLKKI